MTLECSCPSTDAVHCVQLRHGLNLDEAHIGKCECTCHLPENQKRTIYEEEEDAFYDKLRAGISDSIRPSHPDGIRINRPSDDSDYWWLPFWKRRIR